MMIYLRLLSIMSSEDSKLAFLLGKGFILALRELSECVFLKLQSVVKRQRGISDGRLGG